MDIWARRLQARKQSKMRIVKSMPHKSEGSMGDMVMFGNKLVVKGPGGWNSYSPDQSSGSSSASNLIKEVEVKEEGYLIFNNELMIQWGDSTGTSISTGQYEINFHKEFTEEVYVVICVHSTNPAGHGEVCGWDSSNTTTEKFRYLAYNADTGAYSNTNGPVAWIAIGK
jgi:hypothetical protein